MESKPVNQFTFNLIQDRVTNKQLVPVKELIEQLPDPSISTDTSISIMLQPKVVPQVAEYDVQVIRVERRWEENTAGDSKRAMWILGAVVLKYGTVLYKRTVTDENGNLVEMYDTKEPPK